MVRACLARGGFEKTRSDYSSQDMKRKTWVVLFT